ncbi:MAG: amidophosphoribosyltransferase [Armatimonadota bacterium]
MEGCYTVYDEGIAPCSLAEEQHDTPHEECGVFGIYGTREDVARMTYFGLFALQHRGQESAGIAVANGGEIVVHKRMGLVTQVFDEAVLREMTGVAAIGHTRYSTTGSSVVRNAQPIVARTPYGPIAVAHNGNLLNSQPLRRHLESEGASFEGTNDSEIIAKLIAFHHRGSLEQAVRAAMKEIRGSYSLAILGPDRVLGVRDPHGVRPLCIGQLSSGDCVLSSESCALNVIGATMVREVEPGELVVLSESGLSETDGVVSQRKALCVFEFIYFARPDSYLYGRSVHLARRRMGHELAREHPAPGAQLIIPVPDSGVPAAIGYAEASRIPFGEGFTKSRYIHRTFIQPDQAMRDLGVRMKFSPLREALAGKRVVVVDDSIVRGTSTSKIVSMLFEAGATEVHLRISSPPIKFPCFYGIDMDNQDQLIAARLSVEEIRQKVGATSLAYLSLKGVLRAIGLSEEYFCSACFDGKYPIEVPEDIKLSKLMLETAR